MRTALLVSFLGLTTTFLSQVARASAVTFELKKDQKECFYTLTSDTDCKISYYFSVQEGGENDHDVSYEIFGPGSQTNPVIKRAGERQGEWEFIGDHKGEYKICFDGGRTHDKVVDFEISYSCERNEDYRSKNVEERKKLRNLRDDKADTDELQTSLENSVDTIERQLYILERNMKYYKARNNRNHHTVSSTDTRIAMFSIYGILLVVGMSVTQIFVLQWFFKESRQHKV